MRKQPNPMYLTKQIGTKMVHLKQEYVLLPRRFSLAEAYKLQEWIFRLVRYLEGINEKQR